MKSLIKSLCFFLSVVLLCVPTVTVCAENLNGDDRNVVLLRQYGIPTQNIVESWTNEQGELVYELKYSNYEETITINKISSDELNCLIESEDASNSIEIKDGNIILDGNKIQIKNTSIKLGARIYDVKYSNSPMNGLRVGDYNKFVASGTQDILLGKAIDCITAGTLSIVLGKCCSSLSPFATGVYDVGTLLVGLKQINSKVDYISARYVTYSHGYEDYKYTSTFYTGKNCTGRGVYAVTYAHYTIY